MEIAQTLSNDLSASCPLTLTEKVDAGAQKGEDGTLKDGDNSFLLTLLNMLACSTSQPLNTILGQYCGSFDEDGESDQVPSLIDTIGDGVLNTESMSGINGKNETTGKDIDASKIMNMIILSRNGQLITSDMINGDSLPVSLISGIEDTDKTLANMINTNGDKSTTTSNAINDLLNMESVKNTLLNLIDEAGESNETDADYDLIGNIAGKKVVGDNVKMIIDSSKYQSAIKIDEAIGDQSEKPIQDSGMKSVDNEIQGNEVDGNRDTSGVSSTQNEKRENVNFDIDGSRHQFANKDLKIVGERGKNSAAAVAALSGEELSDVENNNKNKEIEKAKVKNGHVNDFEKFGLGVTKTSVTVNSQESSIESNKEIMSPKNKPVILSDKIGGNISKSDSEKFGDNSDNGDSSKNNNDQNEKILKGHEITESIKNNKTQAQSPNGYTFTTISNKNTIFDANIHYDKSQDIETEKNIESQLFTSRQSDIQNSELSAQSKSISTNDRLLQSSILSQVIDRTSVSLKKGLSSMEIKLKPESLGNLRLHVSIENNQVGIKIITEGHLVKEIIENNIMQLKSELQSQGMEITKVVVVADHDQSHNRSNNGHSKFASFAKKKDDENQNDNQVQWNVNHVDGINEGKVSFFA